MKKLALIAAVLLITTNLVFGFSLETKKEVKLGPSKFKLPIFVEYDLSNTYAGCLVSVLDYEDLLYLDIGYMANNDEDFLNMGISTNIQALCDKVGLHYRLPAPLAAGISIGRALYDDKNVVVGYIGLAGEFDK